MIDYTMLHASEAEQAVIGAILSNPDCADNIGQLRAEHFFAEAHRTIFGQIVSMIATGLPVDVITVSEALHSSGNEDSTGGLAYLGALVANTPGSASVRRYAEIIVGKSLERHLLAASDTIKGLVTGTGTTREKLMSAQSAVMAITEGVQPKQPRAMREILADTVEVIEQRREKKHFGTPTGFDDVDRLLNGGMRAGNVIVVAGRPGMGKTSIALNVATNVANEGKAVAVFSMEMPEQELVDRLIAQVGSVALSDVLLGNLEGDAGDRILFAMQKLNNMPFVIDDQGGLTLFELASKARTVKRKNPNLGLIVVDYLQLMEGDGDNRNAQIEGISRGIKALAKEIGLPIILLSQLNRGCEARNNKRPMNSDLRESGAIEQDADIIVFVYRDEVYNPDSPDRGTAEIIIGKNRQGQTGTARLAYQGEFTRFSPLAHGWAPAEVYESPKKRRSSNDF